MSKKLDDLIEQLCSRDLEQSISVVHPLSKLGSIAVEPLIRIIQDENARDCWWLAAETLGLLGDKRAVEPLINLLKNPASHGAILARKYTVYALSRLSDKKAVNVLINMLHERLLQEEEEDDGTITVINEPEYETIEAVAGALAEIGEWDGIKAVIDRMLEGDFWYDHRMGEWSGEAGFQYVLATTKTDDQERLCRALSLLGEFEDKRALPILVEFLNSDQPDEVRSSAAYGLAQLRASKSLSHLLLALIDPYEQVRVHVNFGVFSLVMGDYYVSPDEPDLPSRIRQAIAELGEEKLIDVLLYVIESSLSAFGAYGVLFLKAFAPYLSHENVENRVKPALELLSSELQSAVEETLKRHTPFQPQ